MWWVKVLKFHVIVQVHVRVLGTLPVIPDNRPVECAENTLLSDWIAKIGSLVSKTVENRHINTPVNLGSQELRLQLDDFGKHYRLFTILWRLHQERRIFGSSVQAIFKNYLLNHAWITHYIWAFVFLVSSQRYLFYWRKFILNDFWEDILTKVFISSLKKTEGSTIQLKMPWNILLRLIVIHCQAIILKSYLLRQLRGLPYNRYFLIDSRLSLCLPLNRTLHPVKNLSDTTICIDELRNCFFLFCSHINILLN